MSASRWEHVVWPRWLPVTARLPVLAQVTGAVALTALIMGPWWSKNPPLEARPLVITAQPVTPTRSAPAPASMAAHLNLDIRHRFSSMDVDVDVDGKRVLATKLDGNAKKFRMFGKRAERRYARTLDLASGTRVVRVRLRADKFDQTRTESFELASASVAVLRIDADNSGLTVVAERPAPRPAPSTPVPAAAAVSLPPPAPVTAAPIARAGVQDSDAAAELLQSIRSMLIAIAGFVASAATGFIVQEYLRTRKSAMFADEAAARKRRRAGFAG